jgi:indole-3-glycerol phosphate synthase
VFLDAILASKRTEVAERRQSHPLGVLEAIAEHANQPRNFLGAIRAPGLSVIAEIKRASPSKGPIRPDLDPPALAREYEAGGCSAISVLTDGLHFGAREGDLRAASGAVSVPVLRKDFLIDEYQLWESRAMGADAVLLIVAAMNRQNLRRLVTLSGELGMCPLVEVHAEAEVEGALDAGAQLIGINNRDLRTFRVDLETTRRLKPLIPPTVAVVSESGIAGARDAALVRSWGVDAVLVGEALVSSGNPANLIEALSSDS